MKRILLIASAVTIVAGCAKVTTVDTAEPQEIAFKAYNYAATKAPIEDNVLPDGYNMYVHAFHQNGSNFTEYFSNNGVVFEKGEDDGYWSGNTPQYWPPQGTLTFNAISPVDAISSHKFNLDAEGDAVASISATLSDNSTNQYDLLVAQTTGPTERVSAVNMTFDHALAQVQVTASASADGVVTIKDITLDNSYQEGNVVAMLTVNDDKSVKFAWDTKDKSHKKMTITSTAEELKSTAVKYPGILVVPEQELKEYIHTLTITYDYGLSKDIKTTLPLTSGDITAWEAGKKYIYNIGFSANEIKINPHVATWDEEVDGETVGE